MSYLIRPGNCIPYTPSLEIPTTPSHLFLNFNKILSQRCLKQPIKNKSLNQVERQWTREAFQNQYIVLYSHLGLLSNTTAVGAAWSFARSPHWHRPIEASLCSAFQHKIGSTGLCQLASLVRILLLQGVQKTLNKQTYDAMWERVFQSENVTIYCKEGSSKLNCINGGGNKQAKDLWLVSFWKWKIFIFFFNRLMAKDFFCLQQDLMTFCVLFALLMNPQLPACIWLRCAQLESITGHHIEVNNTGFPLCLSSYHVLQLKIKFSPPNPRGNEARSSAAPIQHCENCTAISSRYTTAKVLLDNNLLIKQQQLIKAKKLICTFYSLALPSMQFPSYKNASGNAILQTLRVNTYNKSILLVTSKQSNKNYPTLCIGYSTQQTENSSFGA